MILRIPSLAVLPLFLAAFAASAAPSLSVPMPRPAPEREARLAAEPAVPPAPPAEPVASAAEGPSAAPVDSVRSAASGARSSETNAVFRRDPFWPVSLARARKADHDARIAAAIEESLRAAAIEKIRQDAIARGVDVSGLDEDEIVALDGGSVLSDRPKPKTPAMFAGATEEDWDAAFAKLPPRSGYFGGPRPALMLRGDKTPHYVGDELCVTNRGVVFVWCVESVDFRAYSHELKRISAKPVP